MSSLTYICGYVKSRHLGDQFGTVLWEIVNMNSYSVSINICTFIYKRKNEIFNLSGSMRNEVKKLWKEVSYEKKI